MASRFCALGFTSTTTFHFSNWGAHASRVLLLASRRNELWLSVLSADSFVPNFHRFLSGNYGAKNLRNLWMASLRPGGLGRYFPDRCDTLRCLSHLVSLSHVARPTTSPKS